MAQIVAFANIKDNPDMPRADVVEDFQYLKRNLGRRLGILGNCEIGEVEDHVDLAKVFRTPYWYKLHQTKPNPITVRNRFWSVLESEWVFVHKGVRGIMPAQGIGKVVLQHRFLRKKVAVLCCHPVNGAFKPEKFPDTVDIRRDLWFDWHGDCRAEINELHDEGISVFVMGDYNRALQDVNLHSDQRLVTGAGIDGIFWIPGGLRTSMKITVEDKGFISTKNLNTDHLAPWVKVTFHG